MKTKVVTSLILFIFNFSVSFAQEQTIKLKLDEGKTYVFCSETKRTEFDSIGTPNVTSVSNAKFRFEIEKVYDDSIIFASIIESGISQQPDERIKTILDIKFPPVVSDINKYNNPATLIGPLLTMIKLRFQINLKNNAIKQTNKEEVMEKMHSILVDKGYDKKNISKVIDYVFQNNAFVQNILMYNQLFLYFNQSEKFKDGTIESKFFGKTFYKTEDEVYINGENLKHPGSNFSKVSLNEQHGFISNYYNAKYDSINERWRTADKYFRLNEMEFAFLEEYETENNLFTFKCTIENPKDSIVTLFYLDKPYGDEYSRKHLKLDENNKVSFQTRLPDQSFIFFANRKLNYAPNIIIFYAEPHDTIDLNFYDNGNSSGINISGSNNKINQVLYDIQKAQNLFYPISSFRAWEINNFDKVKEESKIFDNYLVRNNVKLEKDVYSFIKNELVAREYYSYYAFLNRFNANIIKSNENRSMTDFEAERAMALYAYKKIKEFDIHDIYNDYGIFSRQLSIQYFYYWRNNLSKIKNPENSSFKTIMDEFKISKMILGGNIFYRVMAERIISSMLKKYTYMTRYSNYELKNAFSLINQLYNQSYSENFNEELINFLKKRQNWEDENFIPDGEFCKPDGEKTTLKNIVKGRPTVLYVNNNWATYRYGFDAEAKNDPDIRFVMIMQGDNLKKWQEYLEIAEPVADQLLLMQDDISLDDIFLRSNVLYIAYDKNGKLLGYDIEEKTAIKLAKQSLTKKKELDKSQLQIIIFSLLIILFTLIIGILFWKWRVRQRFRKEEQQRRLRELELTAIRSQMNPHFLFNSLNSVQNLVQQNKGREAHLYLSDFAGLIRKVLQNSEKEEVSLAEELEMIKQYLNLEKLRFDFDFSISVEDGIDANNTMVPSMLLQPFAENAVIHGLQNKEGSRKLTIDIRKTDGKTEQTRSAHKPTKKEKGILIVIEDNGIGRKAAGEISKQKNGKGSKLMKERLEILQQKQGEKYHLEIIDLTGNETGTRVEILIPEEV